MSDDIIAKPAHYEHHAIEPYEFISANNMEFWRGNIVKYAARAGHKNYDGMSQAESEVTDLRKAIRYAEMRINEIEGRNVTDT